MVSIVISETQCQEMVSRALSVARNSGIVIVGASNKPSRASYDVMASLLHFGLDCVAVNPVLNDNRGKSAVCESGTSNLPRILGQPCYHSLASVLDNMGDCALDQVVCVFRGDPNPSMREALDLGYGRKGRGAIWLQQGLFASEEMMNYMKQKESCDPVSGVCFVENRCLKVEYARRIGKL